MGSNNGIQNRLEDRSVASIEHERPIGVEVVQGTAYVTHEGDWEDYIVKQGQELCIRSAGLTVIQGFPSAEVKVSS